MAKENKHIVLWIILVVLILALIGTCGYLYWNNSSENEKQNEESSLWLKIRMFEGEMQLDSLENAISDYQWFFPHGKHANDVRDIKEKIETERKDWISAKYSGSIDQIEDFIRNHSNSFFRHDADRALDSLYFIDAQSDDTYASYENYLNSYSDGMYAEKAKERMAEIDNGTVTNSETVNASQVINEHFIALANNDSEKLKETIADAISTYMGKSNARPADVEQYMQSMHSDKNRTVSFELQNIIVTKEVNEHKPTYNVHFLLYETIATGNHTDKISFIGLSHINDAGKIISLILSRNS